MTEHKLEEIERLQFSSLAHQNEALKAEGEALAMDVGARLGLPIGTAWQVDLDKGVFIVEVPSSE